MKNDAEVKSPPLTNLIINGTSWLISGSGFVYLLHIATLFFLARLLTPGEFGVMGSALIIISFFEIFSRFGIDSAIIQRAKLEEEDLQTAVVMSVTFGMLCAIIVLVLASGIGCFFKQNNLVPVLQVLTSVFIIRALSLVSEATLQRKMRFHAIVKANVVSYFFGYCMVAITLAYFNAGVWALVFGYILRALLKSILLLFSAPFPKNLRFDLHAFKNFSCFGGGLTFAKLFNFFAVQGDKMIVSRWLGAPALGIYNRSYNLTVMPGTYLSTIFDRVFFPAFSKIQNNKQKLVKTYLQAVRIIALVTFPISALIYILAPEIINILLGPAWKDVLIPFQIFAIGMVFRAGYKISGTLIRGKGAIRGLLWCQATYASAVFTFAWIGHYTGLHGIATGVVVALLIQFLLMSQLALHLLSTNWKQFIIANLPGLILAFVCLIEAWFLSTLMRGLEFPSIIVLFLSVILVLFTVLVLILSFSQSILGLLGDEEKQVCRILLKKLSLLRWIANRYVRWKASAFLISFPKCGRTWLRMMIGRAITLHFGIKDHSFELENVSFSHSEVPWIVVCHEDNPFCKKPEELSISKKKYKRKKIIFLTRDPRDVVISMYFEMKKRAYLWNLPSYQKSLSSFIHEEVGSFDTIIKYYNIWAENRDTPKDFLLVRYEDIHANPSKELRRVLNFIGVPQISNKTIAEATEYASFKNMQKLEKTGKLESKRLTPGDVSDKDSYKIREGKIKSYVRYLNQDEILFLNNKMKDLSDFYRYNV